VNPDHDRHHGDSTLGPAVHLEDEDSHDHGDAHQHEQEPHGGLHAFVASVLRPHSHDAVNSVDTALQTSREGMTALKISLAVLAVTASVQVAIVVMSGSVVLLADTIHNFADALTAVPLGLAFWLGRRPADRRYTYGYGRAEDLAGVLIILIVAASAAVAGWEAVERLIHPQQVRHIGWVIAAGLIGFAGNELVAHYRIRIGRKIGSAALEADGYHARTDGVTSLGVVAGAVGVALGWQAADPVFGLAITFAILFVVKNAARDIYRRLMDGVDPALVGQIGTVLGKTIGIETVDAVRVRWIGHQLHAEAEVTSDADLPLSAAHAIAEDARHQLLHQVRRLSSVIIHTNPSNRHGVDPHSITAHHFTPFLPKPGPDSQLVT
jgi:cation diffusion facilitator family transporter